MSASVPHIDFLPLLDMGTPHAHSRCCWCRAPLRPVMDGKFWRCPQDACFQRQLRYWVLGATEILFIPTPIQTVLFEAVAPLDADGNVLPSPYLNILFGGSRGSSKSYGLRWLAHWLCLHFPHFQVLMVRRTLPELEKSQLKNIRREQASVHAELSSKYELTYENGSMLTFGHCAEVGDEAKYLSSAYDLIIFDEETTFEVQQILDISSSARKSERTPKNWRPLVVGGTNPGGISGAYCRALYVHKTPNPDEHDVLDYNPDEYLYVQSMLEDNPFMDTAEYEKVLKKNGPVKYKAWRLADWDATEDQFFHLWRKHDATDDKTGRVLKAHEVPLLETPDTFALDRFCSLKWGMKQPGVCYWWACLVDGTFFIEDEYKFHNELAKDVATVIKARNEKRGISIRYIVCSPDMAPKAGQLGESIIETFRKAGLNMVVSKHDPVIGWNRVHALLDVNDKGVPWMRFSKAKCPYACKTIPSLIGDPTNPEDIAKRQLDHAAIAIRQGAMSRPYPTKQGHEVTPEMLKGKAGYWRYEIHEDPRPSRRW